MSQTEQISLKVEMKEALSQLSKPVVEKFITAALVSGALLIANQAKKNAPIKSGSLRRSIHVGGHTDKTPDYDPSSDLEKYGAKYGDLGEPGSLRAIVGTNLEYAPYQEYGTGPISPTSAQALHWIDNGVDVFAMSTSGVPAHPFLTPALNTERDNALKEIGAAFEELVAKEVGKL